MGQWLFGETCFVCVCVCVCVYVHTCVRVSVCSHWLSSTCEAPLFWHRPNPAMITMSSSGASVAVFHRPGFPLTILPVRKKPSLGLPGLWCSVTAGNPSIPLLHLILRRGETEWHGASLCAYVVCVEALMAGPENMLQYVQGWLLTSTWGLTHITSCRYSTPRLLRKRTLQSAFHVNFSDNHLFCVLNWMFWCYSFHFVLCRMMMIQ